MVVTQRLWDMLERTKQERLGKAACRGVLQALFVVDVLCRRQNLLPSNWIWVTVLISGPFDSSYHMLEGFLLSQLLCKDLSCGYIRKELDFKIHFCYDVLCSRIRCKVQVFCTMWCQLYPEWFLLMLYRWRLLPGDTHTILCCSELGITISFSSNPWLIHSENEFYRISAFIFVLENSEVASTCIKAMTKVPYCWPSLRWKDVLDTFLTVPF